MSRRVALQNLGCKVNRYESDAILMQFENHGYEVVDFSEEADIYLVNTCAVTAEAARKSRQFLRRPKHMNPHALVVGLGCQTELLEQDGEEGAYADLIIGNAYKDRAFEIVEEFLESGNQPDFMPIDRASDFAEFGPVSRQKECRAYIKVQDGCNNFCSYCTIPFARGRVRSRSRDKILQEARALAKAGYKEVVLTGIHVCSFEMDQGKDSSAIVDLALEIGQIQGIERIRLTSLEPQSITKEFVDKAKANPKLCPHFHLSLQSGSDKTLKAMNRKYDTTQFRRAVQYIKEAFPLVGLTTDVIVGFPGEDKKAFEESRDFCKEMGFSRMHVFRYSERPGTRAVKFPNKVPASVAKERSQMLIDLAQEMEEAYFSKRQGQEARVLLERKNDQGLWQGYTEDYIPCAIEKRTSTADLAEGEIVKTILKLNGPGLMHGEIA